MTQNQNINDINEFTINQMCMVGGQKALGLGEMPIPLARRKPVPGAEESMGDKYAKDSAMPRSRSVGTDLKSSRVEGSAPSTGTKRRPSLRKARQGEKQFSKNVSVRRGSTGSIEGSLYSKNSDPHLKNCMPGRNESTSTLNTKASGTMYESFCSSFSSNDTTGFEESSPKSSQRSNPKTRSRRPASTRKRDGLRSASEHVSRSSDDSKRIKSRRSSRRSSLEHVKKTSEPREASEGLLERMKVKLEAMETRLKKAEKELASAHEAIAELQSTREEKQYEDYSNPDEYEFRTYYGNADSRGDKTLLDQASLHSTKKSKSLLHRFSLR